MSELLAFKDIFLNSFCIYGVNANICFVHILHLWLIDKLAAVPAFLCKSIPPSVPDICSAYYNSQFSYVAKENFITDT